MNVSDRIQVFELLGKKIGNLSKEDFSTISRRAFNENNWFTELNVKNALEGIAYMLQSESLEKWTSNYDLSASGNKDVGVVMAGNIPMVGFHDLMCVLLSGHKAIVKVSSQDNILTTSLISWIAEISPELGKQIETKELLKDIDAVIATGSDNTSRYFEYYFKHIPNVIRKNRTSVAVLTGDETQEQLADLADDIYLYFGLGCRNVSKVFIPEGFDLTSTFPHLSKYNSALDHHKYRNNYDYNKSIYLINKVDHFDTGYSLWTHSEELVSPISVIYYEYYQDQNDLAQKLSAHQDKIQCTISSKTQDVQFGKAQRPELWDYADNIDTLQFLIGLN